MRKYACLFIEDWECPIFKRLGTTEGDLRASNGQELQVLVNFCTICPHIKKK